MISSQPWLLLGRSLLSDPWWIRLNPWVWVNLWKKVSSMVGVFHCWKKSGIQKWPGFLCFWVSKIDHVWWRWTFNIFQPQNFKADTWSAQEIQKKYNGWRETCHFCRLKRGCHSAALEAESYASAVSTSKSTEVDSHMVFPLFYTFKNTYIYTVYISYVIGTDIYIYTYISYVDNQHPSC